VVHVRVRLPGQEADEPGGGDDDQHAAAAAGREREGDQQRAAGEQLALGLRADRAGG